ncbi:unnamed protein product [Durusdinium trenchii]|uniref:Uncharacterized protein n=1 Tax=Durusdinium trenchii TaxID=1381693 RepID=A0ABP0Q7H7_9DINO
MCLKVSSGTFLGQTSQELQWRISRSVRVLLALALSGGECCLATSQELALMVGTFVKLSSTSPQTAARI